MIADQADSDDPDSAELRRMAEDERREILAGIEQLEGNVTVRAALICLYSVSCAPTDRTANSVLP